MIDARPSTLNLTPSPRILEMIAEVDLQLHQCLGELIDNAFDELIEAAAEDSSLEPRIDINLPTSGKAAKDSAITVDDNGRGMSPLQLEASLSAGTSGRQRFGSLGLFGMGFNIATARLGTVTEVRTGRRGDTQWVVARVDLTAMKRASTYEVPLRYESKSTDEHGTRVTVTNLRDDMLSRLKSNRAIKETVAHLGRIYTYMLRDPEGAHSGAELMGGANQNLYVNNTKVRPHLPCIWDPTRSVTYKGAEAPAATKVDVRLTNAFACMTCGRWYSVQHDQCLECESTDIEERERRIWGWLGIQRYADKSDFGLTFLRHGRAITNQDKSLFNWETPDGDTELEYPIELGMGRIVGEIHLDHAPVNVRKNAFDTASSEWRFMVEKLRGPEPLRPQIAMRLVGRENTSPVSRFFNAYRENKAGLRYLMPGNGTSAIHDTAKRWAAKFRSGDPEFQNDEKWYEAAKDHDKIKAGPTVVPPGPSSKDDDWLEDEGLSHLADAGEAEPAGETDSADEPEHVKPETEEERFARYREASTMLPDTDRKVRLGASEAVLRIYVTSRVDLGRDGAKTPYAIRVVAGEVEVYVDASAELISHFGWAPMSVALMCAAPQIKNVFSLEGSVDQIVVSVLEQFPDRKVDGAAVRVRADALLDNLRERLAELIPEDPAMYWNALSPQSRQAAETVAISIAPDVDWGGAIESGEFARYVGADGIADLVMGRPDLVMDGRLFRTTYAPLGADTQADQVARVAALLADLRRMVAGPQTPNTLELSRFLLTADLLDAEIVPA